MIPYRPKAKRASGVHEEGDVFVAHRKLAKDIGGTSTTPIGKHAKFPRSEQEISDDVTRVKRFMEGVDPSPNKVWARGIKPAVQERYNRIVTANLNEAEDKVNKSGKFI